MFSDAHAHLSYPQYDDDRDEIVKRLQDHRVSLVINPGTDVETSRNAIELAKSLPFVYANVGLHPDDANRFDPSDFDTLESLSHCEKVVAIGEIGLDYHYPDHDKKRQEECFREMLRMAKRRDLPVVIHSRDAWDDTFRILEEEKSSNLRGMMHCFSGGIEEAERCLRLGFKISIPGIVTFKKSNLPDVVAQLSLDDILTETDCPWLAPVPHRGKRNEPAFVVEVAKKIADIKGVSVELVAEKVFRNLVSLMQIQTSD
ncbi:MAG: TatD family hydrolase [Chloroherpetonaceae bacterium]|nr:TatD family hydrolase [Chloroherpetonaceae bacterium]MDW8437106.1 TatD family hydrolase [Chloroherpetonaceae bacterium]